LRAVELGEELAGVDALPLLHGHAQDAAPHFRLDLDFGKRLDAARLAHGDAQVAPVHDELARGSRRGGPRRSEATRQDGRRRQQPDQDQDRSPPLAHGPLPPLDRTSRRRESYGTPSGPLLLARAPGAGQERESERPTEGSIQRPVLL